MKGARPVTNERGELRCIDCGTFKPATREHFLLASNTRSGLTSRCRGCAVIYRKAWRAKDPDGLKKRRVQLYAERYAPRAKAKAREREAREPFRARAIVMRAGMRERAKERDLPFDGATFTTARLTEMLRERPACPCCGVVFRFAVSGTLGGEKCDASPSVDRIRPALGYVPGNVAIICWRCNNLKRDASAAELRRIADWIESTEREGVPFGTDVGTRLDLGPPRVGPQLSLVLG